MIHSSRTFRRSRFVGFAFIHTRRAGGLFTLGLLINALLPITLPWV